MIKGKSKQLKLTMRRRGRRKNEKNNKGQEKISSVKEKLWKLYKQIQFV